MLPKTLTYYEIDEPFTRAFEPQKVLRARYRLAFPFLAYGTVLLLFTTWVLIIILALNISNSEQIAPEKKIDSIACQLLV